MSPKGKSISLGQYSTFQYMLAPPSLARPIVERIPSVVFYGEPRDEKRNERDHYSLFATEPCTLWKYYLCCLLVLPSHALGMSEWGSGVVVATAAAHPGSPPPTKGEATDPSFRVLRRFRYSYYRGLLEVDTYHVLDENENDDNNGGESFRLVEFLSSPNQLAVWAFIGFFYTGIPAVLLTAKHAFGQLER
ncbi:unnamed protein product [Pseudo-nitzschia multistriata]|uniref:Uncharacterized protein n=1 Tax=Pseudo-nitzschia multistriata TaxID=183589 RepID=A0A448ZG98_9STRA|nr:unnamed protein product [Pseudo-nitzschia multistriata]